MNLLKKINNRGVSLLEAIIAMSIFLMIIGGVVAIMQFGFFSRDVVWEQLKTQSEGRRVIQGFIDEIRTANESSLGSYPIEAVSTTEFIFFSNIDDDSQMERVRYFSENKEFIKGIINPSGNPLSYVSSTETTSTIAHDIENDVNTPVFEYYGQNYDGSVSTTPLTYPIDVTQIRMVHIKLLMEEDPNISPAPFLIEAKAHLRNLKSN